MKTTIKIAAFMAGVAIAGPAFADSTYAGSATNRNSGHFCNKFNILGSGIALPFAIPAGDGGMWTLLNTLVAQHKPVTIITSGSTDCNTTSVGDPEEFPKVINVKE